MDCLFCKIVNGEIPCAKVYEDDKILAFNDINPVAPYHILIVPKQHFDSIADVDDKNMEIVAHIHSAINKIAIDKGFSDDGFRIINNCRENGGQEVKHLHYHVLAGKKLPLYEAEEK